MLDSTLQELRSVNIQIRKCPHHCGCANAGLPGWFGDNYKIGSGLLMISQCPGQAKVPFLPYNKIIWKYTADELPFDEFQQLYFDEWKANQFIGSWTQIFLKTLDLDYSDVCFTNLVKCPFDNNMFNEKTILKCQNYLSQQINALKPKVVAALGSIPASYFLTKYEMLKPYVISRMDMPYFTMVCGVHPSRALPYTAKLLGEVVKKYL